MQIETPRRAIHTHLVACMGYVVERGVEGEGGILASRKGKYDYPVGELFHQHLEQINENRRIYVLRTSLLLLPGSN